MLARLLEIMDSHEWAEVRIRPWAGGLEIDVRMRLERGGLVMTKWIDGRLIADAAFDVEAVVLEDFVEKLPPYQPPPPEQRGV